MSPTRQRPVTFLTGFLGAGKTTALNHLLSADHGVRLAIIINEFGQIGLDRDLVTFSSEDVIEMANGCLCCTLRGDLTAMLMKLVAHGGDFDQVVVETTGLADPGALAMTMLEHKGSRHHYTLDGIVTLVDAYHLPRQLGRSPEVPRQIAFADVVLLNKVDLIDAAGLAQVEASVRALNPQARVVPIEQGRIDPRVLLDVGGFDPTRLEAEALCDHDHHDHHHGHGGHDSDHDDGHRGGHGERDHDEHEGQRDGERGAGGPLPHGEHGGHGHHHGHHDPAVGQVSVSTEAPLDGARVDAFLNRLSQDHGDDLYRSKGILHLAGHAQRCVFQGVHHFVRAQLDRPWGPDEPRISRAVFIGRGLDAEAIQAAFMACAVDSP